MRGHQFYVISFIITGFISFIITGCIILIITGVISFIISGLISWGPITAYQFGTDNLTARVPGEVSKAL